MRIVNERAFERPNEASLVDALRGSPGTISLVATLDARLVGHILFTAVSEDVRAPISRLPGSHPCPFCRRCSAGGIGSALVRAGLATCRERGYRAVVVLGHPAFYPRFGFAPAAAMGLTCEWPMPPDAFMALELDAGALVGASGVVRYRPEFSTK